MLLLQFLPNVKVRGLIPIQIQFKTAVNNNWTNVTLVVKLYFPLGKLDIFQGNLDIDQILMTVTNSPQRCEK